MKIKQFIEIHIGRGINHGQFRFRIRLFQFELVIAFINWKRIKIIKHENN